MSPNGPESIPHAIANFLVTKLTDATIWVQKKNNKKREKARRLADRQVNCKANNARRRALGSIEGENRSLTRISRLRREGSVYRKERISVVNRASRLALLK